MDNTKLEVRTAKSGEDWEMAKTLILEYVHWLGFDLSFQKFDDEMADLPKMYNEKDGGMILALIGEKFVGVVGLRRFSPEDAEIKRMFVREKARGKGVAGMLVRKCIEMATSLGYRSIKLDTADYMTPAINLYLGAGFAEISAYRYNPYDHARYFEYRINS